MCKSERVVRLGCFIPCCHRCPIRSVSEVVVPNFPHTEWRSNVMKMYTLMVILIALAGFATQLSAETDKSLTGKLEKRYQSVVELSKSANLAAESAGVYEAGSISCDSRFIRCTCEGAINCAWLALACGEAGGIQGHHGECFLPDSVPGSRAAVSDFAALNAVGDDHCSGLFCTCKGPKDSADCKEITVCADEFLCVGDTCSCVNGSTD